MVFHVLGYLTLAAQLGGCAWLVRYMYDVGSRPWTWQRRVPVPQTYELVLSAGSDYVGRV